MLDRSVLILHDNAGPHKTVDVTSVLDEYRWETLPHPPYSPDMSPCDYDLFMKLKEPFRDRRFPTLNDLNNAITRRICELNSQGLLDGIQKLPERWERVIQARGDYIEDLNE